MPDRLRQRTPPSLTRQRARNLLRRARFPRSFPWHPVTAGASLRPTRAGRTLCRQCADRGEGVRRNGSAGYRFAKSGTRVQFPPPPLKGHFVNYHKWPSLFGLWKQAKPGSAYLHLFARRSQILHRQRYSSSWRSSRSHVSLAAREVGAGERGASSFGVYTDISWHLHWTLSDSRLACHSVRSRASGSSAKVIVLCG